MGRRNRPKLDPVTALRRRAARLIWTEFFAQAAAPAVFLLLAYLAAALYGLANPWAFASLLLLAALSLVIGLAKIRPPGRLAIDRRIETASGLKHRPLAALDDEPEDDSPFAIALWTAHRARTLASLATARIGPPAPAAAARDPWSLRGLLGLALITGLIIAGPAIPARLAGAFMLPAWPFAGPTVTGWITQPDYVNQPPLVLEPGQTVTALAGSKLTIIAAGVTRAPAIRVGGRRFGSVAIGDSSHRADITLTTSGALLVGPWWHRLAHWQLQIVPPGAPTVAFTGLDIASGNHLKLHWRVTDPYGLQKLTATIAPDGYPDALVQSFSLPAGTGDAAGTLDLSTSPFHDLPVSLSLTAENAAGVTATTSWNAKLSLPGLGLHDDTAKALDQLRQTLATDPRNLRIVATGMQRLAQAPLSRITAAADVKLAVLACAIWLQQAGPQPAVDRMLALIQEIEAGPDYAPAQALAAANQALAAALRRGLTGQALGQDLLQHLLDAMHAALAQHLAALQSGAAKPQGAPTMDMSTLDRMARQIAADEAAGRTAQAAQELKQLQSLMNQLASAKPMTAQQMAQAAAAAAAAQSLSQITQGEAALLDRTHQGNGTPGDQAALQNQLDATRQSLAKAGLGAAGLSDANNAMAGAQTELSQQNGAAAEDLENAAIHALQKAAAALAAQQRNSFGLGQGAPAMSGQDQDGPNGGPDEQSTPLNLGGADNPARVIEQQIINQDAAPAVPAPTHSYYHRLLEDGSGQ
jgi:hypothetical protein